MSRARAHARRHRLPSLFSSQCVPLGSPRGPPRSAGPPPASPAANGDDPRPQGWWPFNSVTYGRSRLGQCDLAFLGAYALGMFFSGHLGDNTDLRLFLTVGMLGSGLFTALFGMGMFWKIHSFWYFVAVQIAGGLFQSTGWPSVVAVMGSWFGKVRAVEGAMVAVMGS